MFCSPSWTPIPSFADYAANLTEDEVRQPLGALLSRIDAGAGLYSERANTAISHALR